MLPCGDAEIGETGVDAHAHPGADQQGVGDGFSRSPASMV
jgi:hypothetical protein